MKKGQSFMPAHERVKLVRALDCVDAAVVAVDDDRTVCATLAVLHPDVFTNGGDQTNESIPEAKICKELGIHMSDGLGGKVQSSSWLLARNAGEEIKVKADPNA
jgi:bifunctional ADP-heptose synthase (sugar kinase/adenylyltransferase)